MSRWSIGILAALAGALPAARAEGPLLLCQAPAWSGETQALVAWFEGRQLVLAAARERDPLPGYLGGLGAIAGTSPRQVRLPPATGAATVFDGAQVWLQLAPGLRLACEATRED